MLLRGHNYFSVLVVFLLAATSVHGEHHLAGRQAVPLRRTRDLRARQFDNGFTTLIPAPTFDLPSPPPPVPTSDSDSASATSTESESSAVTTDSPTTSPQDPTDPLPTEGQPTDTSSSVESESSSSASEPSSESSSSVSESASEPAPTEPPTQPTDTPEPQDPISSLISQVTSGIGGLPSQLSSVLDPPVETDTTEPIPEPSDPTTAPSDPTDGPSDPTDGPSDPTAVPSDPTAVPSDPTDGPSDPTGEPEPSITPGPPAESQPASQSQSAPNSEVTPPPGLPSLSDISISLPDPSTWFPPPGPSEQPSGPSDGPTQGPSGISEEPSGPSDVPSDGPSENPDGPTQGPSGISENPDGPTQGPSGISDGPSDGPTQGPSDISDGPSDGPTQGPSGISDDPVSEPTSGPSGPSNGGPSISFPSSAPGDEDSSAPPPSPSSQLIDDQFTFLTDSSLAVGEMTTATTAPSMSDADQPTFTPSSVTTIAVDSPPQLPKEMPYVIYPSEKIVRGQEDVIGMSAVTLLFDQGLNWPWVVNHDAAAIQIFGHMPGVISNALQIPASQVKGWALKPYVPSTYRSAQDANELGTTYITYIPSDRVNDLAVMIRAKQSSFYTAPTAIGNQLAARIVPSFAIDTATSPLGEGNGGGPNGAANSSNSSSNSRQDAIIGVVSALGGIALLVLLFLLYRAWQRKREMAHRRMSDPPAGMFDGSRPEGRAFDQDSIGGNRRRSFYFAEDSLRGPGQEQQQSYSAYNDEYSYTNQGGAGMTQRRVGQPISAPMLRENTMNW